MSDSFSSLPDDEKVLVQFLAEREDRGPDILAEYCDRYPHLKERLLALVQAQSAIDHANPEPVLSVPERLGDFHLRRPIGRGGMGQIYEAIQQPFQRRVAVKTIRRGRITAEARDRFLREQEVLARLHQTHIVPIHAAGEHDNLQYFAMPFIEGAALDDILASLLWHTRTKPGRPTPTLGNVASDLSSPHSEKEHTPGRLTTKGELVASSASGSDELTPAPVASPAYPRKLSPAYFRSVAQTMRDAALALQHAHDVHILHRDVKPANIMVDRAGQCWIIDFGLASFLNGAEPHHMAATGPEQNGRPSGTRAAAGTLHYMAPEQFRGEADVRRDIWGLGATLYELLTLRRAFDGPKEGEVRRQIERGVPRPPRELIGNVPRDLAAICLKALRKEPAQRYQTGAAFAEDLRRWLDGEPTSARPARAVRRVFLWGQRNKGWAAALLAVLIATIIAVAALVQSNQAAQELARRREQELRLMRFEQLRLGSHTAGWFEDLQSIAKEIIHSRKGEKSEDLRDAYAAALTGLDAKQLPGLETTPASSVAFSQDGKRFLLGGYTDFQGCAREPARVWKGGLDEPRKSSHLGSGPVAFRAADGAALHFVPDAKDWFTVRLWNLDKQELVHDFKLADTPSPPGWQQSHTLTLAFSPDGSLVAASTVSLTDGPGRLIVWDVASGKPIRRVDKGFSALAFTPDGGLLAAGDRQGEVTLWARKDTKEGGILPAGRTPILALAFGRDPRRRPVSEPTDGWLLAVGDAGSSLTIWDLKERRPRTTCRGSAHSIHAAAFTPDGALLASTGRYDVKVWDAASGQLLLNLKGSAYRNWLTGLAFSPDGRRLAVSSLPLYGDVTGGVDVWQLENGRGIQTLRGLANRATQVTISRNDRFLAALDDDWKVGIWEVSSGRLLHVLEPPPGYFSDNAALALSPTGDRLAFASGSTAKLWDTATGSEFGSWRLSPGISDRMAFDPTGKRLLFVRVETEKGDLPPLDRIPWQEHPRVARAYDLLSPAPARPFVTFKECTRHVLVAAISPDASYFVLRGMPDPTDPLRRIVKVLDGATGRKELLSLREDVPTPADDCGATSDPTGKMLALQTAAGTTLTNTLFAMPSGTMIRPLPDLGMPTVGGRWWIDGEFLRDVNGPPVMRLDPDGKRSEGGGATLNVKGTHLAYSDRDGTVRLFDFEEIQRRLAAAGPIW